jgi:hypothetical protein
MPELLCDPNFAFKSHFHIVNQQSRPRNNFASTPIVIVHALSQTNNRKSTLTYDTQKSVPTDSILAQWPRIHIPIVDTAHV